MKDETADVAIEEFAALKPKICFWQMIVLSKKSKGCKQKCC